MSKITGQIACISRGHAHPHLDSGLCQEKLYILLALFLASKEISSLEDDGDGCPIGMLLDEFQTIKITQLLIEIAISTRQKDDNFFSLHGIKAETHRDIVGVLYENRNLQNSTQLTLREANHKIIHSKLINFDAENINHSSEGHLTPRYLNPKIYLYGEKNKIEWKAELDIIKWIKVGVSLFP